MSLNITTTFKVSDFFFLLLPSIVLKSVNTGKKMAWNQISVQTVFWLFTDHVVVVLGVGGFC